MDSHVRPQPAPQPVGEQPANVVHVRVGEHHVGQGCGIDAGGHQSRSQPPGPREVRVLHSYSSVDEHGPAAATHHAHVQPTLEHVREQEYVFEPGPPDGGSVLVINVQCGSGAPRR